MKRVLVVSGIIVLVIIIAVAVMLARDGDSATTATTIPTLVRADAVVADGTVLPVERAELSFATAGRVVAVLVNEGDTVVAGEPLVALVDDAVRAALAAAEADMAVAQAGVNQAEAGVEAADAAVDKAEATRDGLSDGSADWRVDAADADVALTQAQLRVAQAGDSGARARLEAARANVRQAQVALDESTLVAPFAGTVTSVDVKAGDLVGPSLVAVRVADLTAWEIVTTDLNEASVASLTAGARVEVTFDALPGVTASGTVTLVGLLGRPYQGTTVYPITVVPDGAVEGLRWGLTATVSVPLP
jgi:multidrug efflux pump subunit AcrA (membrane-fusion protein)